MTSPRKVTPLPPALLLEEDFSEEEDGPYGIAHSPSQLHVKYQDSVSDEYYEHQQYAPQYAHQERYQQGMVSLPSSLVTDLQSLISDYRQKFPTPLSAQDTVQAPPAPVLPVPSQPPPIVLPDLSRQDIIPVRDDSSDDDKGPQTIPDPNREWDEYVIPDPASPVPDPVDSPPADIGGFHNLMERASKRFGLSMSSEQTECFLYDFKE